MPYLSISAYNAHNLDGAVLIDERLQILETQFQKEIRVGAINPFTRRPSLRSLDAGLFRGHQGQLVLRYDLLRTSV